MSEEPDRPAKVVPLGTAPETDTALPVRAVKSVTIGTAEETDTALPVRYRMTGEGGPLFEWRSYLDLLGKARRDLARLRDEGVSSDGLFDFLATAAHVFDWVTNDLAATGKLKEEAGHLQYGKPPGPAGIVYLLCTRAKHMVTRHQADPPPTRVERFGWGSQPWGTSPWSGGLFYYVEVEGEWRNVLDVGGDAIAEWEALLTRHARPIQ